MFDFDTLRPAVMVEPEAFITRRRDLRQLAFTTAARKLLRGLPLRLAPETSVAQAAQQMRQAGARAALVVCSGSLLGTITDADVAAQIQDGMVDANRVSVWQAMTPEPPFCLETDSMASVLRLFKTYGVRQLPVMEVDGPVVGLLDLSDVLAWLSDQLTVAVLD
jgi:CBS domain-containing protein